jgi:hypothetical protein
MNDHNFPPKAHADAYYIAGVIVNNNQVLAENVYQRIVKERKLKKFEAVMLSSMALKFSIKYEQQLKKGVSHV